MRPQCPRVLLPPVLRPRRLLGGRKPPAAEAPPEPHPGPEGFPPCPPSPCLERKGGSGGRWTPPGPLRNGPEQHDTIR